MRRGRGVRALGLAMALGWPLHLIANRDPTGRDDVLRAQAFEYAYNLDYDEARSLIRQAADLDPEDPANYRSLASITWLHLLFTRGTVTVDDYLGKVTGKDVAVKAPPGEQTAAFRRYVQKAVDLAQRHLEHNAADPQAYYDLGAALGLQASYAATIEGRVSGAFGPARRAYNAHEKVLELDNARLDAGLVVGTYRYVVASLPTPLRWIAYVAGFGGDKTRAITLIESAARTEGDTQTEAKFALVLLYNREKRYGDAVRILRDLQRQFPRNRLLWLEAGATNLRAGRPADALVELNEGLAMLERDTRRRMFGEEALWHYKRGLALGATGRSDLARNDLTAALDGESRQWVRGRTHLELGRLADLGGDRAEALVHYDKAIRACRAGNDRVCLSQARARKERPFDVPSASRGSLGANKSGGAVGASPLP